MDQNQISLQGRPTRHIPVPNGQAPVVETLKDALRQDKDILKQVQLFLMLERRNFGPLIIDGVLDVAFVPIQQLSGLGLNLYPRVGILFPLLPLGPFRRSVGNVRIAKANPTQGTRQECRLGFVIIHSGNVRQVFKRSLQGLDERRLRHCVIVLQVGR